MEALGDDACDLERPRRRGGAVDSDRDPLEGSDDRCPRDKDRARCTVEDEGRGLPGEDSPQPSGSGSAYGDQVGTVRRRSSDERGALMDTFFGKR